jgi:2,3-diketo-5-methylthio-1-phosphopentane phosphatase
LQDTGHLLFDKHGCGPERRAELDNQIHTGERSFRDVSEEMWGSLNVGFDDGFEVMKEKLVFDPDFADFHAFCVKNNIPFNVISAGLKPLLRAVLEHHLGPAAASNIDIISNDLQLSEDGKSWAVVWRDDTPLGHDKAASVQAFKTDSATLGEDELPPLIVFIGDGVSDLPAAREADILFARRGLRLEEYCIENKIEYQPFDSFSSIKKEIKRLALEDKQQVEETGVPKFFNPRANFWRRASSKGGNDGVVTLASMKEAMKSTSSLHGGKTPGVEKLVDPMNEVAVN